MEDLRLKTGRLWGDMVHEASVPGLLGRDLTTEERRAEAALQGILARRGRAGGLCDAIRQMAEKEPEPFCSAAISLLGSETDPEARRWLYNQLVECPEFLVQLTRPDRFNRSQLLEVCRNLMTIDSLLDVRLARLTPGRQSGDRSLLEPEAVVLVLDILNEISAGGRLILLLNHLTQHEDRRIAAKATLMVGKRLRNQHWVARRMESGDERVRASVVEGLWNVPTTAARRCLWDGLNDKNNRVVGNALIGLHQLGEPAVHEFVKRMIEDPRPPFRWTAAWVMGQIGGEEFVEFLERALQDKDPQVQRSAQRALTAIRPPVIPEPEPAVAAEAGPAVAAEVSTEATVPSLEAAAEIVPEAPVATPEPEITPSPESEAPAAAVPPQSGADVKPAEKPASAKEPVPAEKPTAPEAAPEEEFTFSFDGSYKGNRRRR